MVGEAAVHELIIIAYNGSPLTHRDVLGVLEAEASGVPEGADLLSVDLGQPPLTGILHHLQIVTFGNLHDPRHVRRDTQNVYRHDGPRPLGDLLFNQIHIHLEGLRVDVDKDGDRTILKNGLWRGDKGVGGQQHLISGTNIEVGERYYQGIGSVDRGHAAFGADRLGPLLLKFADNPGTGPDATPDRLDHPLLIRLRIPDRPTGPAR